MKHVDDNPDARNPVRGRRDRDRVEPDVPTPRPATKKASEALIVAVWLLIFTALGLVYWLWPQIQIFYDVLTQKFNFYRAPEAPGSPLWAMLRA